MVKFDRYARVSVPNVWPVGRRNPVTYVDDVERVLGLPLRSLRWRSV
jgi:hypothetical protein